MSFVNDPTRLLSPRVKITSYDDKVCTRAHEIGSVEVPYDMKSLKSTYSHCVKQLKTSNGSGSIVKFNYSEPSQMNIKLLLDDTTYSNEAAFALPANLIPDSVDSIIKKLLVMFAIDGELHSPRFIRVTPLQMPMVKGPHTGFSGFLSSMEISNDIVDSRGNRIKATVDLKFMECKSASQSDKQISYSSPDLTHIYQTFGGDKLVNKVNKTYGEPDYVHSVAEANGLNTVRHLKVGGSVEFPPLDR
ncbi:hypothetical protein [Marinomonas balearica]|uniref:Contractile injection system tube protein N-terminal domain-containing protein n=1 Tax=Marinomonas balearica TaxID=491947 RepID=A0A4R6M6H3_9GAMM|nr:hypothetical protein [Marinomonas balearica]TDO96696.1 hypothetical protein DFP79_2459 [Marinomonas balearica]